MLQEQLNKISFTSDKSKTIIMVGDLNLPDVHWVNDLLLSPFNSISQYFRIQKA